MDDSRFAQALATTASVTVGGVLAVLKAS